MITLSLDISSKKKKNHNLDVTKKLAMVLEISNKVSSFFEGTKESVVKNTMIVCQGIFKAKSVNLNEVKLVLPEILENKETKIDSHYKRLTRFFNLPDEQKRELSESLLRVSMVLLGNTKKNLSQAYLTLDGTKWYHDDGYIHLLTLCIVVNGVSIPIWWEDLSKKGHSSQAERLSFFKKALSRYDLKGKCLLADREYIGRDWFDFLKDEGINFVIRLPKDTYREEVDNMTLRTNNKETSQHLRYSALEHRARLTKYHRKGVAKEVYINQRKYLLVIVRNLKWKKGDEPKEELLYLLTTFSKRTKTIKAYAIRWSIECCFRCLKSKGFDLEAVNLKGDEKIFLIVAIVSFLYTLCVIQGISYARKTSNKIFKKLTDGNRQLIKSYFKLGKEELRRFIFDVHDFVTFLNLRITSVKSKNKVFVH